MALTDIMVMGTMAIPGIMGIANTVGTVITHESIISGVITATTPQGAIKHILSRIPSESPLISKYILMSMGPCIQILNILE